MTSTSSRRAAFAALALAPVLTACGFNAPTDQPYQPAEGIIDRSGQVDILNALVVSGADGSGTLIANLVNNDTTTADALTGVTGPNVTVGDLGKDTAIPAGGSLNLADTGQIALEGESIKAGGFVELTLSFENAEAQKVKVPVVRHDGDYADIPVPSGTAGQATEPSEEATEESSH